MSPSVKFITPSMILDRARRLRVVLANFGTALPSFVRARLMLRGNSHRISGSVSHHPRAVYGFRVTRVLAGLVIRLRLRAFRSDSIRS